MSDPGNESDGTFTISRADLDRAQRMARLIFEHVTMSPHETDPDCLMPDGDPRAADRWTDDGGRAP